MAVRLRLEKGDVEGHPFRGNQWTEGQGGSESNNENNAQGRMEFWTQGGKYAEQHARVSTVINNLAGLFGTPPLNVLIAGERGRDTRGWYHHAQNEDKYPTNIHGVPRPGSSVIIAAHPAWIHVGPILI